MFPTPDHLPRLLFLSMRTKGKSTGVHPNFQPVMSRPIMHVAGKEAEFNEWYKGQHVPDIFKAGRCLRSRFRLADAQFRGEASRTHKYLALYEIETSDLDGVLNGLRARGGTADIVPLTRST